MRKTLKHKKGPQNAKQPSGSSCSKERYSQQNIIIPSWEDSLK